MQRQRRRERDANPVSDVPLTLSLNLQRYASGTLFSLFSGLHSVQKEVLTHLALMRKTVSTVSNISDTPCPFNHEVICRFVHKSSGNVY